MAGEPKLPPAVQAASDRADELINQATAPKTGDDAVDPTPAADAPTLPQAPAPAATETDWQQKWRVADGMLKKQGTELSVLQQANAGLVNEISGFRQQMFQMQQQLEKTNAEPPAPKANFTDLDGIKNALSEDEVRQLDADGITDAVLPIVMKLVNMAAGKAVQDGVKTVATQVENIKQDQTQTKDQRFLEGLNRLMPDWRALNDDPGCVAWLKATIAPGTSTAFFDLLNMHNNNYNHAKVAEIFGLYKDTLAADEKAKLETPAPLAGEVEPGASGPGNVPSQESERLWKSSEVQQAYNNIARGVDSKTGKPLSEADKDALYAEIDLANAQGRIDPTQ